MRPFTLCLALGLLGSASCRRAEILPADRSPDRAAVERTVYAAALNAAVLERLGTQPEVLAIADSTYIRYAAADTALAHWRAWASRAPGQVPDLPADLQDDFRRQNQTRRALHGRVRFDPPRPFASDSRVDSLLYANEGTNSSFWGGVPYRRVLVRFSAVGLSADFSQALVLVGAQCGGRCGEGSLVLLRREATQWRLVALTPLWIS